MTQECRQKGLITYPPRPLCPSLPFLSSSHSLVLSRLPALKGQLLHLPSLNIEATCAWQALFIKSAHTRVFYYLWVDDLIYILDYSGIV